MNEIGEGGIDVLGGIGQAGEFCDLMRLVVCQESENLLVDVFFMMGFGLAYITLATILGSGLTKVGKELARAALVVRLGIMQHGMDAFAVLREAVFVDITMQLDMLSVFTALQIANGRHITTGDEVEKMALGEGFQHIIGLRRGEPSLLGNNTLVDVAVVSKESAIVAQKRYDDTLLVR